MAEVPEVEILVRDLQALVVGRELVRAEVLQPEAVRFPEPAAFATLLAGRRVERAERRAKYILSFLSGDVLLAMHCMLDGTLRLTPGGSVRNGTTLIVYTLHGGDELHFLDRLGYARAAAGPVDMVWTQLKLDTLGPEALDPAFDTATLARQLAGRRGKIKSVLLNQQVLAGLGNRDADESLWQARIDPRRPAASLNPAEIDQLHAAILAVLAEGIRLRGTMTDLSGQRGQARQRRNVYGRTGLPCPRCGTPISFERLGGQITHFCTGCQV